MRRELLACAALALLTAAVYAPVRSFPFISYDDPYYITENPHLAAGLSPQGLRWALWNDYSDNFFPLTWLSHLLDRSFFGVRAGPHHLVSAALHAVNAMLLYAFLRYATGSTWRSWIAATVFALHPLRVESVAWVSERKDVLSGLFFLLTLIAYVWYARRRTTGRYAAVVVAYAAALMSKPMVVTLPFVLLLLDYWPLRDTWGRWRALVPEKLPLLAMAAALCAVTVIVQQRVGAVKSGERYTMPQRLANAAVSYVRYVEKTVWPRGLVVFYAHPRTWPAWNVAGAVVLVGGATYAAWRLRRAAPYLPVGWLWFLGMLVPVIGVVQVGDQAMADRYTYLPGIGLVIAAVWGTGDVLRARVPRHHAVGAAATAAVLGALVVATSLQLRHWSGGTITLFRHAVDVSPDNWLAHRHLGSALADANDFAGAEHHLRTALRLTPYSSQAHYNYGNLLARQQRFADAAEAYRAAVKLDPRFAQAHNSLGAALAAGGDAAGAEAAFRAAIQADPAYADPHANLGTLLAALDRWAEAEAEFREALRLRPGLPLAVRGLDATVARRRAGGDSGGTR